MDLPFSYKEQIKCDRIMCNPNNDHKFYLWYDHRDMYSIEMSNVCAYYPTPTIATI